MGVVVFDPTGFRARYPEFAAVSYSVLGMLFTEATGILNNGDASYVADLPTRAMLLNMLVAHIAKLGGLAAGDNGQPGLVGRIQSASQGSVSVSTGAYGGTPNASLAYLSQTPYGAAYYQQVAKYRAPRTIPGRSCSPSAGWPWLIR